MTTRIALRGKQTWHLVDAKGQIVGRLASQLTRLITGKYKPTYAPNVDCGDHLVIINCEEVVFTGRKWDQKLYRWHTGYPGGLKERSAKMQLNRKPEEILRHAISGMLPKNKLRPLWMKKVHIIKGSEHSFQEELQGKESIV